MITDYDEITKLGFRHIGGGKIKITDNHPIKLYLERNNCDKIALELADNSKGVYFLTNACISQIPLTESDISTILTDLDNEPSNLEEMLGLLKEAIRSKAELN
jgi:hypothetical protein